MGAGVLDRLGFQPEGVLRHYRPGAAGREDRVMYALLAAAALAPR